MKSWQITVGIIIAIMIGAFFFLSKPSTQPTNLTPSDTLVYFWSVTCPHCKNVADFLETWQNTPKLKMDKKEISQNADNQALFTQQGAKCDIPSSEMGVPLLVTYEGKCITGDTPVINYFKSLFPESSDSATISAQPTK